MRPDFHYHAANKPTTRRSSAIAAGIEETRARQCKRYNISIWIGGSLKKPFTLIGEVFGQGSQNTGAQLGLRYTPVEKIDFDLIYGRNLTGEHANWITLGVNLRN